MWTGAETGLFGHAGDIKYEVLQVPTWIRREITAELDWFNSNLDAPEKLERSAGRRGKVYGVCWFRPGAGEAINRARYMAWLMTEAGYPALELRRDHPGEIIWRDDLQVVAKPPRELSRMFQ